MRLLQQFDTPGLPALVRGALLGVCLAVTAVVFSGWLGTLSPDSAQARELESASERIDRPANAAALPDFAAYESVDARKEAFFDFLQTHVQRENQRVMAQREALGPLYEIAGDGVPLSRTERRILHSLARQYELDPAQYPERDLAAELMLRVDKLPMSLVLAQAANESAWGTSRFAREANNLFGQWCFSDGCGMVPSNRSADASHEVRAFASVAEAVQAYFHNLNTNEHYDYLRRLRSDMRRRGEPLDSLVLTYGLTRYSARGFAYVSELQRIIRHNSLHELDAAAVRTSSQS